jgi:hypothetical protein
MSKGPTVFEETRSDILAAPIFFCVFTYLGAGLFLFRPGTMNTEAAVARIVFVVAAVACTIWLLRWRRLSPAKLTIEHDRIVRTPRGGHGEPQVISRRPDSRLRTEIATERSTFSSAAWYVLFDLATANPRVKIDNFGRDRVTKACTNHGWAFAPGEKPSKKAT